MYDRIRKRFQNQSSRAGLLRKAELTRSATAAGQAPRMMLRPRSMGAVRDLHGVHSDGCNAAHGLQGFPDAHARRVVVARAQLDENREAPSAAPLDGGQDLLEEPRAVFPQVPAAVCPRRKELVDQVAVGGVDLDAVEA